LLVFIDGVGGSPTSTYMAKRTSADPLSKTPSVVGVYLSSGEYAELIRIAVRTLPSRAAARGRVCSASSPPRAREDMLLETDVLVIEAAPFDLKVASILMSGLRSLFYGSLRALILVTSEGSEVEQVLAIGDNVDLAALERYRSTERFAILDPSPDLANELSALLAKACHTDYD
jgi:hypothetical protein